MRLSLRFDLFSRRASILGVVGRLVCLVLSYLITHQAAAQAPDPSLFGKHPLNQAQAGDLLRSELRCTACHGGSAPEMLPPKTAPSLEDVGARITPGYLQRFLESPHAVQPGTTMPDMLASRPTERKEIAEGLTHFLIEQSKNDFTSQPFAKQEIDKGRMLFHSVGCVACHGPQEQLEAGPTRDPRYADEDDDEYFQRDRFQPPAISLGHVPEKYSARSLSEFLFQPLHVRSSGRMPDMKLTRDEAQAIAQYLTRESQQTKAAIVPDKSLAAKGKQYFQELNCVACHAMEGMSPANPVLSLDQADLTRGCLSKASSNSPQFHLNEAQQAAVAVSLKERKVADTDQVVLAKTMTAFNCIACHKRDDFGGVHQNYDPYFHSSEKNLGDDGRIPPPLTGVGGKLQPIWLRKVLFDGESVRPYMETRMPQYGKQNLAFLPDLLARLDSPEKIEQDGSKLVEEINSDREREKQYRAAGRELLGDKGLSCVTCHNFNGKAAPVNKGLDIITTTQRLQYDWFNHYLRNPGAYRPRTVMPSAWPNGVAAHKTILNGDTDAQIQAIWYFLSLGRSAPDPSGIRQEKTMITADDQAKTYRGRSRVAGFRGIAVGFPEKINYAFNAQTGTLSAIWQGDFINVNWGGQGAGDFHPAARAIQLDQDVSFMRLADDNMPWPRMPTTSKETPVNPDPLYPKNLGYQFRGYYMDDASIPTLMYRSGSVKIEDRSYAVEVEDRPQLKRTLKFDSPQPQTLWFRALSGDVQIESEKKFRTNDLALTISAGKPIIRPIAEQRGKTELLLPIKLPQGESTLELIYEPINH
ncbi:c-type cytochrome [bacterium]|nr:c-type cytochrome [bacterium]